MPDDQEALLAQAAAERKAGRPAQAQGLLRRLLAAHPDNAAALYQLGLALIQQTSYASAAAPLERAVALPGAHRPGALNALASAYICLGRPRDAEPLLREAIALDPAALPPRENLCVLLAQDHRWHASAQAYRDLLALAPDSLAAWMGLGLCCTEIDRRDEAIVIFQRIIAAQPAYAEAHYQLGRCLMDAERYDEAAERYTVVLRVNPADYRALNNLASCRRAQDRAGEALTLLERAVALAPDDGDVHQNRAHLWLTRGEFAQGWREYEWRWRTRFAANQPAYPLPRWDGRSSLRGKTILVYAEQGLGDTLHFVRYLPPLKARGARVVFHCQEGLRAVLERTPGYDEIAEWRRIPGLPVLAPPPPAGCDCAVPLMSLPLHFGTDLRSIPAPPPYIAPDPQRRARWAERLAAVPGGAGRKRIGLVWSGSRKYQDYPSRSVPLAALAPLAAAAPDALFFSLQRGLGMEEAADPPPGMTMIDWSRDLADFAETAALVDQLDLVVSVDTSTAHLAAALGRPVWLALPVVAEWRWLERRPDSPWYPTMRLFRQPRRWDWAAVFAAMGAELREGS